MTSYEATFTLDVHGHEFEVIEGVSADDPARVALVLDEKYGNTLADIEQVWEG